MEVTGKYSSLPASMRTMRGILHPSESGLYTSDPGFWVIICLWFVVLSFLSSFSVFLAASQLSCCCITSIVSDSVRPHGRQPNRLCCPWDSPGKNTGVGCHFLLQWRKVKSESEVTQSCLTLRDPMDRSPPGSSVHGIFQARVLEWGAITFSAQLNYLHPNCSTFGEHSYTIVWYNFLTLVL